MDEPAAMDERARRLAIYDAQLRGRPDAPSALRIDRRGPLWLTHYAGGRVLVTYRALAEAEAEPDAAAVAALVADAAASLRDDPSVTAIDWKARGHDAAPGLHEALVAEGFVPDEPESVMLGEAARLADAPVPEGVRLRRVEGADDLLAFCRLQAEVFGIEVEPMRRALADRLAVDSLMEIWIAETKVEGRPLVVSGGRLEPVQGAEVAGLWGGATLADWRGRGIYRAVTAARARSAIRAGRPLLHSDSTDDSRPILERAGFLAVTTTTPYRWRRNAA